MLPTLLKVRVDRGQRGGRSTGGVFSPRTRGENKCDRGYGVKMTAANTRGRGAGSGDPSLQRYSYKYPQGSHKATRAHSATIAGVQPPLLPAAAVLRVRGKPVLEYLNRRYILIVQIFWAYYCRRTTRTRADPIIEEVPVLTFLPSVFLKYVVSSSSSFLAVFSIKVPPPSPRLPPLPPFPSLFFSSTLEYSMFYLHAS